MDAKTCYAIAIGLTLLASLFLGLTALGNAGGAQRTGANFAGALDVAIGLVALGAAGMFLFAGRARAV